MMDALLQSTESVQILLEPGHPALQTPWLTEPVPAGTFRFSGDVQRKIQRALADFWQERFISLRTSDAPTARDLLLRPGFRLGSKHYVDHEALPPTRPELLGEALSWVDLDETRIDRELTRLSNGELRRVLLARGYMEKPHLWILQDPYGGLDAAFRAHLRGSLTALARQSGVRLMVFLRRSDEYIPGIAAWKYGPEGLRCWNPEEADSASAAADGNGKIVIHEEPLLRPYGKRHGTTQLQTPSRSGAVLFALEHVEVSFGGTTVLGPLDWTVRAGEHWAILGPNGAGKSTLLGLLTADHPQMYRNNITLFGEKPGQGLDIWTHRTRIGFFSPELALHYQENLSVQAVVCTGFGLGLAQVQESTHDERLRATALLTALGLVGKAQQSFLQLDSDERRLVLVARALARPPRAVILDEPTQGMDPVHRDRLFALLDSIAHETTLLLVTHYAGEWPGCITHVLQL